MKFAPIYKTKIWGGENFKKCFNRTGVPACCGESWEISGVDGCESVVANGFLAGNTLNEIVEVYMGDLVGDSVFEKFGNCFPLLVKFIDAKDDLSVQVHPNDELALKRHNSYGKTEMWYVMGAEPGSKLINGFARDITPQEYQDAIASGDICSVANVMEASRGDVFYMPAGRIHAIGKGLVIAEIQQTSDITYRIFDYNRRDSNGNLRELHTDLAKDALDYKFYNDCKVNYSPVSNQSVPVVDCNYFTTNVLDLDMPVEKDFPEIDSFIIYICVEGKCRLEYDDNHSSIDMQCGESVLVPASIKNLCFYPEGRARLMEVYIKQA